MSAAEKLDTDLEAFRAEARKWLEANFPSSLKGANALSFMEGFGSNEPDFQKWKKAMGEKGWGSATGPAAGVTLGRTRLPPPAIGWPASSGISATSLCIRSRITALPWLRSAATSWTIGSSEGARLAPIGGIVAVSWSAMCGGARA